MVLLLALLLFTLATCGHALSASRKSRRGETSMTIPAGTFLLQGVKNLRDLAGSVDATSSDLGISIQSGKVIRLGCPSKATEEDVRYLKEEVGMKGSFDLIDLRSPKEWRQDQYLFQNPVYEDYTNYRFSKVAKNFIKLEGNTTSFNIFTGSGLEEGMERKQNRRYFVPLMNTRKIASGTFKRFRKRTKLSLLGWSLLSIFSRRARKKARSLFIDKLNGGGLSLLNEILIDSSGHEIAAVLKLLASNEEHGAAVYCTAGKDRTGLIIMFVLSVLGASDNDILSDYVKSDSAYADINSEEAMVMAMEQRDIDSKVFLRAPSHAMRDTLSYVRQRYGSINRYLNSYGFNDVWRNKLRNNLLFG